MKTPEHSDPPQEKLRWWENKSFSFRAVPPPQKVNTASGPRGFVETQLLSKHQLKTKTCQFVTG